MFDLKLAEDENRTMFPDFNKLKKGERMDHCISFSIYAIILLFARLFYIRTSTTSFVRCGKYLRSSSTGHKIGKCPLILSFDAPIRNFKQFSKKILRFKKKCAKGELLTVTLSQLNTEKIYSTGFLRCHFFSLF